MMDIQHESEPRWWDIRRRGTIANFAAKVTMTGVMLLFVGEKLIDHSKNTVDNVFDSKTELIRQDIQGPMDEVRQRAVDAGESIKSMEKDVNELKAFLADEFGVEFNDSKSGE